MPEITADTPRRDLTIQGVILSAPVPYTEGHVLEANEAGAMNQTFCENLRNNFAAVAAKFYKEHGGWDEEKDKPSRSLTPNEVNDLQRKFDEYVEGYEIGVRTGGRGPVDPVMSQALQLAEVQVKKAIKSKGLSISEIGREKIRSLCEEAVQKNPKFLAKAKEIHDARQAAVDELSVDIP